MAVTPKANAATPTYATLAYNGRLESPIPPDMLEAMGDAWRWMLSLAEGVGCSAGSGSIATCPCGRCSVLRDAREEFVALGASDRPRVPIVISETLHPGEIQPLLRCLNLLITQGVVGVGNYLIANCGDYYVQFAGKRDDPQLYCEAVSNNYLGVQDRGRCLTARQIAALHRLGFSDPTVGPRSRSVKSGKTAKGKKVNFFRHADASSELALYEIGAMTVAIFRDVYRCPPDADITLSLHMDAWE